MERIRIVTHSGGFHADDVFAVATLLMYLKRDEDMTGIEIVRTRDKSEIQKGDFVVDVGFEYDSKRRRFDHHQMESAGEHKSGIPYASFGLVWKEFGEIICNSRIVADVVERNLVEPIDAGDTGINLCEPLIEDVWQFGIGRALSSFNPERSSSPDEYLVMFYKALDFALVVLKNEIRKTTMEEEIRPQINQAYEEAEDKRLVVFKDDASGWSRTFMSIVLSGYPDILYFVKKHLDGTWQIVCVQEPGYISRKALPESWRGKEDEELDKAAKIEGGVFCHNTGFMAIAKTKEAILELAKKALEA